MSQLRDLLEYNLWANELILTATDRLSADALAEPMPELGGSTLQLLDHLAAVEANFLGVMTGAGRPQREPNRPYQAVRSGIHASSNALIAELPSFEQRLTDAVELAWFGRTFTIEQCLVQVATHSVQHRAGIAAGIARGGQSVGQELDYIVWLNQHR